MGANYGVGLKEAPENQYRDVVVTRNELSGKGRGVSECMLGNYTGTVIGVGVGVALGIRKKHLRPFVYAITLGTFADLFYGYTGNCRALLDDYNQAKESFDRGEKKN